MIPFHQRYENKYSFSRCLNYSKFCYPFTSLVIRFCSSICPGTFYHFLNLKQVAIFLERETFFTEFSLWLIDFSCLLRHLLKIFLNSCSWNICVGCLSSCHSNHLLMIPIKIFFLSGLDQDKAGSKRIFSELQKHLPTLVFLPQYFNGL